MFSRTFKSPAAAIVAAICALILLIFFLGRGAALENRLTLKNELEGTRDARALVRSNEDRALGDADGRVVAVEYFDLECPFCKDLHEERARFLSRFQGRGVTFLYRHFPLEQIHTQAFAEAVALECAGILKGDAGFFSLQDLIYANTKGNDTFDLKRLPEFARTLGISEESFADCREMPKAEERVKEDVVRGALAGVDRTPSVVLYKDGEFKFIIDAGSEMGMRNLESAIDALLRD